jgi:hypothetical protein
MQFLGKLSLLFIFSISVINYVSGQSFGGNPHINGGGTTVEFGKKSTFVFNAVETEGGIVGHLVYHLRSFNVSFQMSLDCMEIRGNRATLSGTVTSISGDNIPSYIFPGSRASFSVEDNGNGRNRDKISDVVFGAQCNWDLDTYLKIQGNISIKE